MLSVYILYGPDISPIEKYVSKLRRMQLSLVEQFLRYCFKNMFVCLYEEDESINLIATLKRCFSIFINSTVQYVLSSKKQSRCYGRKMLSGYIFSMKKYTSGIFFSESLSLHDLSKQFTDERFLHRTRLVCNRHFDIYDLFSYICVSTVSVYYRCK